MRLRPRWANGLFDRVELWIAQNVFRVGPDWSPPDWLSWIWHRLIVGVPVALAWLLLTPLWAVTVAWVGTLIYAHDEGAVRGLWPWSTAEPDVKPWIWDGLLDIPLDLALLVTVLWGIL